MSRPKIHHYVPQSILRNFSIDGAEKQVWVYDKETGTSRTEGISTAGGEKYFNHVVIDGKGIDFEGVFDSVDGALPGMVATITSTESVTTLDGPARDALALLAAIQFLRVKIIRESAQAVANQLRETLHQAGMSELAESIPTATENDGRKAGLSLLADARKHAAHLRDKELTLYKAPSGLSFWTSDAPVVMVNHFPFGDLGLAARGVEIIWPISPEYVLSFRCPSIRKKAAENNPAVAAFLATEPLLVCRDRDVDWFNTLQVCRSTRFLYGRADEFDLARRVLDEMEATRPVLFSMSPMGTFPRRPAMPPGISLIVSGRETEHLCPLFSWDRVDGNLRLRVAPGATHVVTNLLADGPFRCAEVYDTDGPGSGMRDVKIEMVSDDPIELVVSHRDPALQDLVRRIDETRGKTNRERGKDSED